MHGTWLNDKKIAPHRDVPITTGDILVFGTEVAHGAGKPRPRPRCEEMTRLQLLTTAETIAPLKVRCECEWFDTQSVSTCLVLWFLLTSIIARQTQHHLPPRKPQTASACQRATSSPTSLSVKQVRNTSV